MKNFALIFAASLLLSNCTYLHSGRYTSSNPSETDQESSRVGDGNPEKAISHSVTTMGTMQANNANTLTKAAKKINN